MPEMKIQFYNILILTILIVPNVFAGDMLELENRIKEFHSAYPAANKDHIFIYVGLGVTDYSESALAFKAEVMNLFYELEKTDKEIQGKIKTKLDLDHWRPRLEEIDRGYENSLKLLEVVVDHILLYAHNTNGLTGELLLYCEDTEYLLEDFSNLLDNYLATTSVAEALKRNQNQLISVSDWTKYLSLRKKSPAVGLKCQNLKDNALLFVSKMKGIIESGKLNKGNQNDK